MHKQIERKNGIRRVSSFSSCVFNCSFSARHSKDYVKWRGETFSEHINHSDSYHNNQHIIIIIRQQKTWSSFSILLVVLSVWRNSHQLSDGSSIFPSFRFVQFPGPWSILDSQSHMFINSASQIVQFSFPLVIVLVPLVLMMMMMMARDSVSGLSQNAG